MMSTQLQSALATTADLYTPLLLILAVMDVALAFRRGFKFHGLRLLLAVLVVYGWMFADKHFHWWSGFDLDYSTHTAASLALIMCLWPRKTLILRCLLAVSLIFYGELMNTLNYHSWADMLTTAAVVAISFSVPVQIQARLFPRT